MRVWLIVVLSLAPTAACAQDPNETEHQPQPPRVGRMQALQEKALRLIGATRDLGNWEEHYAYMLDATDRIFERSGWDSESDLFALEMVREVGRIPPWQTMARFDKALEMVGDRYLLDEDQITTLQSKVIQLNFDLFSRHSDRILEYAMEAIQTRAAGEPFTPDQVARWTELAEPVFVDARNSMNKAAKEFMTELDPEQRELVERDLAAANRRMGDIEQMSARWKRGQWDPHDWGMEDDPIQNPQARRNPTAAAAEAPAEAEREPARPERSPQPSERSRPAGASKDDDAWARYVRAFILKYHLNNEQQQRAWLIYRDAKDRDQVFKRRFERQMKALREKAAASDREDAREAIRKRTEQRVGEVERLFGQLRRRLERLPTRAQRKSAEPWEIEIPSATTQKAAAPRKEP